MQRPALQLDNSVVVDTPSDQESTLPSVGLCGHSLISLTTARPTQFIDITDRITALVAASDVSLGLVNVQALHTTTAILINENEPLLLTDFEATLSGIAPGHRQYRHDDSALRVVNVTPDERTNGHAHCRALLLGTSVCVNIVDGRLVLGRWQRLFFVELDGPRERLVSALVLGDAGARRR
jgi:secondary thiamine-phosphate synthase enzyme